MSCSSPQASRVRETYCRRSRNQDTAFQIELRAETELCVQFAGEDAVHAYAKMDGMPVAMQANQRFQIVTLSAGLHELQVSLGGARGGSAWLRVAAPPSEDPLARHLTAQDAALDLTPILVRLDRLERDVLVASSDEIHRQLGGVQRSIKDAASRAGVPTLTVMNALEQFPGVTDTLLVLSKAEYGILPSPQELDQAETSLQAAGATQDQPVMLSRTGFGTTAPIIRYRYDGRGNIIELMPSQTTSYTAEGSGRGMCMQYDARNRLVSTSITAAVDANGKYRDCLGRVVSTQPTDLTNYPPVLLARNLYNHLNQRVMKRRYSASPPAGDTKYVYQLDGSLIMERTGPTGQTPISGANYYYLEGAPAAMTAWPSGGTYYYHNNWVGTPQVMTDSTGVVRWGAIFDGYVRAYQLDENPDGDANIVVNNIRAPGQYEETETSAWGSVLVGQPWYYNWNRHYMPFDGRYMQTDPIGLAGGPNSYGYAEGNPARYFDPTGLMKLPSDPSGLPPGWTPDPSHRDPNGERWRSPGGNDYLDFHKKQPGKPGWAGKDHWHSNGGQDHLRPGDEVPDPDGGDSKECKDDCKERVATVVVVGGTAYIVYRCIRMVPSLFPPLWTTIPANAAIP